MFNKTKCETTSRIYIASDSSLCEKNTLISFNIEMKRWKYKLFTWTGTWPTCCVPDSVAICRQKVELHTEAKRDDPRLMMQIMLPSRCGWLDPSPVDATKTFFETWDVTEWIRCVSKGKCRCFLRKSNNRRTNSLQFNWSPSPWEIFPMTDDSAWLFKVVNRYRNQIRTQSEKKWITKISTSRFPWNRRHPDASIGQEKLRPDFCCSPVCWHTDGSTHHNSLVFQVTFVTIVDYKLDASIEKFTICMWFLF